ncbi:hypothetical protein [Streptomyces flaveus]|uniref:DUF4352 domain-containing protein n=1 Tax=Streptomyces flaveus TaxID=66370 RepID=A0A917RP46_9ACTN|nr:hypothetical protein [Streptomyces flaveus]GGL16854.1 hypothetical protein GCM10010094_92090 [Streptomyces flaveus]
MDARLKVSHTVAAAVLLVVMAACSDNSDQASTKGTTAPATPTAPSAPTAGAPPGAEVLGTVRTGEPFTVTVVYSNDPADDPDRWQFTVRSAACGKPLDPAVMAHAAESVGSPTPTPTPEAGKQFCVVAMDALNVGKSEAVWNADGSVSLNVGDTRYTSSSEDADYALDYAQYYADKGQTGPTFGRNPGSRGPAHGVFQIPTGQQPTSIWVTSGPAITTSDGVQPGYLVLLK